MQTASVGAVQQKTRKYPKLSASKKWFLWIFVIPTLLLFSFVTIVPLVESIYISFFEWSGYTPDMKFLGFQNYIDILGDPLFYKSAINDFIIIFFKEIIVCAIVILFAVTLTRLKLTKVENSIYRFIFYIPNILSSIVFTQLWVYIFNPGIGLADGLLRAAGLYDWIPEQGWMVEHTMPVLIWVICWCTVGSFMIVMISSINNISEETYEAAEIDGANQWRQLVHITLPAVWTQLRYMMVTILCSSLAANMNIVLPMTNGGPDNASMVMGLYVYQFGLSGASEVGYSNAGAVLLMIIAFGLSFLFNVVLLRREEK
ncbi:MAG: sugar ABC transporter permease [Clostridia bacterium]|nr:sugar ABC transporter permease [Clostridia bacterium]